MLQSTKTTCLTADVKLWANILMIYFCVLLLGCFRNPSLYNAKSCPLFCTSAVHLFSGQHERKHTEHIFRPNSLYRTLCDRNDKSSPGTPELSSVLHWVCPPPPPITPQLVQGSNVRNHPAAVESSSHQGTARSEKQMLISMWEQQEGPGVRKDCVKFSLEEP